MHKNIKELTRSLCRLPVSHVPEPEDHLVDGAVAAGQRVLGKLLLVERHISIQDFLAARH